MLKPGILVAVIRRNRWKLMILVFPTKGRQSWFLVEKHHQKGASWWDSFSEVFILQTQQDPFTFLYS